MEGALDEFVIALSDAGYAKYLLLAYIPLFLIGFVGCAYYLIRALWVGWSISFDAIRRGKFFIFQLFNLRNETTRKYNKYILLGAGFWLLGGWPLIVIGLGLVSKEAADVFLGKGEFPMAAEYPFQFGEINDELRNAAEAGDAEAQFELGLRLAMVADDEFQPGEHSKWIIAAANQHHPAAATELAAAYKEGKWGLERNLRVAFDWLVIASDGGDEVGQYGLALAFRDGAGVDRTDARAAQFFLKSARQGYPASQFNSYLVLHEGNGVQRSLKVAENALKSAERQNYSYKQFVDDNLSSPSAVILGGATDAINAYIQLNLEYAHAVRCAALYGDLSKMGIKKRFPKELVLELENDSEENLLEKVEKAVAEKTVAAGTVSSEEAKVALIRLAALLGDPYAQRLFADFWYQLNGNEADKAEGDYWLGRSNTNPNRYTVPVTCPT